MWSTLRSLNVLGIDASDLFFTLHQYSSQDTDNTQEEQWAIKQHNERIITQHRFPNYYKVGFGNIKCLMYKIVSDGLPCVVLSKRTRKFFKKKIKAKKPIFKHYCKIIQETNQQFPLVR